MTRYVPASGEIAACLGELGDVGSQIPATPTAAWRAVPPVRIPPRPVLGRCRLMVRWSRFALRAARAGWWDFAANACAALGRLVLLSLLDLGRAPAVECNVCGWQGRTFYPNVGPGYHERATVCPGCLAQDRHRALLAVLLSATNATEAGQRVVEVAPMRGLEKLMRDLLPVDYTSFDVSRHAMEHGDILDMRFADASVDWFICFHVLEHLTAESDALREIRRVLKAGGTAVVQVPVDVSLQETMEYAAPDPRDVGHVRRNGRDFPERMSRAGFQVEAVSVQDGLTAEDIAYYGMNIEPLYLLRRPSACMERGA